MATLEKAKLAVIRASSSRQHPQVEPNTEQEVQFNPATLKLSLKNVHDRNDSQGRQVRQYVGSNSESYTLELQFDSADEARNGQPVSVREKTWIIERYLRPRSRGVQPPRLRFTWGDFTIDGTVDKLDLEFDHFAHTGVPLRAKAVVTLKKQDSSLEVLPEEAQQGGQTQASPGQSGPAAPGGGGGTGNEVAPAQAGETPAEFAARMGLDPSAWRGLGIDLEAGLSVGAGLTLAAGAEVGFSAGVGMSVGLGVHVGFEAGVSASVEASFGLSIDASASVSLAAGATVEFGAAVSAELGAGFRLSASGGVEAAIQLSAGVEASVAVSGSLAAFGVAAADVGGSVLTSGGATTSRSASTSSAGGPTTTASSSGGASTSTSTSTPSGPSRPPQVRTPLARAGLRPGAHQQLAAAPPPPRVDPRALSYGRGVPLRRRVEVRSPRPLEREAARTPQVATTPNTAPWDALPKVDSGRRAADSQQAALRPQTSCVCSCGPDGTAPWSIEREEDEP